MSLIWVLLFFVALWPAGCTAEFDGDDFANNLFTDLAPILALFGERVTMQFLSQATGLADCVVLAMAPLGIVTIIVSAIRVGGPTWLKAIIGRARENLSIAEIELMSSTSREACELWNGWNVVRCQGSGQIWQFICHFPDSWNDGDANCPNPEVEVKTLRDALESGLLRTRDATTPREPFRIERVLQRLRASLSLAKRPANRDCADVQSGGQGPAGGRRSPGPIDLERGESTGRNSPTLSQRRTGARTGAGAIASGSSTSADRSPASRSIASSPHNEQDSRNGCESMPGQKAKVTVIRDLGEAAPNVSLNCYDDASRLEIYLAALVGMALQIGVLLTQGIIIYDSRFRGEFLKDDKPVPGYAFPCFAGGTVVLAFGMFLCASIVERSTEETRYEAANGGKLRVVWLQKSNTVNDQVFEPFSIYPASYRTFVTTSRRKRRTKEKGSRPGMIDKLLEKITTASALISLAGFIVQFVGLRAMHWLASIAQLAVMGLMTALRAWIRRGLAQPPSSTCLTPDFELDWFAVNLAHLKKGPWPIPDESQDPDSEQSRTPKGTPEEETMISWAVASGQEGRYPTLQDFSTAHPSIENKTTAQRVMMIRRDLGNLADWRGPASIQAVRLSGAMEVVTDALLPPSREAGPRGYFWRLPISHNSEVQDVSIGLMWRNGAWSVNAREIEAVLSLWLYSSRCGQRQLAATESQMLDERDSRFRAEGEQELGLRLFGSSSRKKELLRDMQWWMPEGTPEILEVEEVNEEKDSADTVEREFSSRRVVGFGLINTPSPGLDEPKRLLYHAIDAGYSAESECDHAARDDQIPQKPEKILAVRSYDPLEKLYSKDLLSRFIHAVVSLPNVAIASPSKIVDNQGRGDSSLRYTKLRNDELSKMARRIEETGFESLSEAYAHLVIPLSLKRKLPDTVLVQSLEDRAHTHRAAEEWEKLGHVLQQLVDLAVAYDPYQSWLNPRAVSVCMGYLRGGVDARERSKREGTTYRGIPDDERLEYKLADGFAGRKFASGCYFSKLMKVQGQDLDPGLFERIGLGPPEAGIREGYPPSFQMTETHLWAMGGEDSGPESQHVNEKDAFGWTPLHYAAATGPPDRLRDLLMAGADPNARNMWGWASLHYACQRGDPYMVADLSKAKAAFNVVGHDGVSPLHCAAKKGEINTMATPHGVDPERTPRDYDGRAPVHWAAMEGRPAVVILANGLGLVDHYGWTPLHLAVIYGHEGLVRCLVRDMFAKLDVVDKKKRTLLHLAAGACGTKLDTWAHPKRRGIVRMLLENGANVQVQDDSDYTPVHYATMVGDVEIVRVLIEKDREGCRQAISKIPGPNHPLCLAAFRVRSGSGDITRELLQIMPEVDAKARTPLGRMSLIIAIETGNVEVVRAMLERGASPAVKTRLGFTPLDFAKKKDHKDMIQLLESEEWQVND